MYYSKKANTLSYAILYMLLPKDSGNTILVEFGLH